MYLFNSFIHPFFNSEGKETANFTMQTPPIALAPPNSH